MTPIEKAIADLDASSRNANSSTSIRFGTWVGYAGATQILQQLEKDLTETAINDEVLSEMIKSDLIEYHGMTIDHAKTFRDEIASTVADSMRDAYGAEIQYQLEMKG